AQGREFIHQTYDRVKELRALSKNVIISVDGGVKKTIAKKLVQAGANILVAGSAIVQAYNPKAALEELRSDIQI
ncbi:MAG: orotidine 5'-phosphate decarboxylase, partial [Candidatus Doudnabacteria bacterium]|nr:orotidine 5'-phosphate decarboxylase [Candidatus Doudnabacteria bacterium]